MLMNLHHGKSLATSSFSFHNHYIIMYRQQSTTLDTEKKSKFDFLNLYGAFYTDIVICGRLSVLETSSLESDSSSI